MFLDVVFNEKGQADIIDTEELDEALAAGIITDEEYALAKTTADRVVKFYCENYEAIEKKLFEYRDTLFGI